MQTVDGCPPAVRRVRAEVVEQSLLVDDQLPTADADEREETVLVWSGASSVGSNAVQLARGAGYRVVATASPHNHDLVRSLGAVEVFDYRDRDVVVDVVESLQGHVLAGTLAISAGSLTFQESGSPARQGRMDRRGSRQLLPDQG